MDQVNTLHTNFIWNNKQPKIKYSMLTADYCEGGYKDVGTENQIAALRLQRCWYGKPNCGLKDHIGYKALGQ